MTSSGNKFTKEMADQAFAILEQDSFYSNPTPEQEDIVFVFIAESLMKLDELDDNSSVHTLNHIVEMLLLLYNELIILREQRKVGIKIHASNLWTREMLEGVILDIPVKLMVQALKPHVMSALTDPQKYKKEFKAIIVENKDVVQLIKDKELKHYQIILDVILEKFPNSKAWLNWIPLLNLKNPTMVDGCFAIPRCLISTRGLSNEVQANDWCDKLNGIPGFENAVTLKKKKEGFYLYIESPLELKKRLENLKAEREQKNSPKEYQIIDEAIRAKHPSAIWMCWKKTAKGSLIVTRKAKTDKTVIPWCNKLNGIPGFDGAVSIVKIKNKFTLCIKSPEALIERLRKLKAEESKAQPVATVVANTAAVQTQQSPTPNASMIPVPAKRAADDSAMFAGLRRGFFDRSAVPAKSGQGTAPAKRPPV